MDLRPLDRAGLAICRDWGALQWVQQVGGGRGLEAMSGKAIEAASAIALITMLGTRPLDYFNGGRAVQRAWLTATAHQVALQPMTALPYLFTRLMEGSGQGLSADMSEALGRLRQHYINFFEVADKRGEIMLCRLARVEAPVRQARRRPVADVVVTTTEPTASG